jgi:hypothetical protein
MKDRCIKAVSQTIGRPITAEEARNIEQRILRNMRSVAAQDPAAFQKMTPAMRLQEAAKLSAEQIVQEAELKKRRVELSIQASDRLNLYINEQVGKGMDRIDALKRSLVFLGDGKSNTLSAESHGNAIKANAVRQLIDTFEAVDPKFWGLFESNEGIKILTKAIFGEQTGVAQADKGAKAWLDVANQMRDQYVEGGGKIGKLEDWNLPQHHSQLKVSKAGRDAWINEVFPKLNRDKYLDDSGMRMSDQNVLDVLKEAWLSISTGGINQMEPGAQGQSMLANRRNYHREIHFKDADSYLDYQSKFGEKSLWGVITGHVEGLSRELAMLETFGPNPDTMFKTLLEQQLQKRAVEDPAKSGKAEIDARKLSGLYDFVSGRTQPVVNEHLAQSFDTLRNWLVSSRLGSAVITALSDEATVHLTAHINNLPELQLIRNELSAFNIANQTEKHLAHRAGLALDTMIGHLNRWGQDTLGPSFSSKMASTVMRASGMEALDGARRRAFGTTMMSSLGEMVGKYDKLTDLDKSDHRILLSKGITDTDWGTWKLAELETWGAGNGVLTPESIMHISNEKLQAAGLIGPGDEGLAQAGQVKREAVLRLLGTVLEETDMAVIRPGQAEKFMTGSGLERGTWKGELTRSFFLFKAFPIAMIYRHWMRGMGQDTVGGKATYIASLIAGTTVLGAVSQTINDLLQGKNPRNYNPFEGDHGVKNWMAALLKGGSLGIYGDFLFSESTQHSQNGPIGAMLGPVAGLVEQAMGLTQGNLIQLAQGKDTKFGAELVRFIRGNTPGANLWYAKAALDHLVFNQLQEYFSPGYLGQMQRRARKEFGQTYFWSPNAGFDEVNAPDLSKAIGQ